ncbi:MAG: tetratricopeptide repeat protein [Enhygromyxa sp.]
MGGINVALGKGEEARRYFEDALAIRKDLVEREPDRSDLRRDLSISYERLATVEPERAKEHLERAIELSRDIVASDRTHAQNVRTLGLQIAQLSDALVAAGEPSTARAAAREALALLGELDSRGALEHRYQRWLDKLSERVGEDPGTEQPSRRAGLDMS